MLDSFARARRSLDRYPLINQAYRVLVGVLGLAVVAVGVVLLPAPGPGWVVIFLGLGILATEFAFARKVLAFTRRKYQEWVAWLGRQGPLVRLLVSLAILLFVAVCAWLMGAWSMVGGWFGVDWGWLKSPFFG